MSKWHYDLTLRDGGARIGIVEAEDAADALCKAIDQEQEYDLTRAVVREESRSKVQEHEDTPCLDPHPFDGVSYPDGY